MYYSVTQGHENPLMISHIGYKILCFFVVLISCDSTAWMVGYLGTRLGTQVTTKSYPERGNKKKCVLSKMMG